MSNSAKWHFKSLSDYEKAKKCLMELSKEQLADAVMSGGLAFRFGDDSKTYPQRVKSYIREISTEILLSKQRVLLDKIDENLKKSESLKGFENRVAWWENHLEYEKLSKESDEIDTRIQILLGIGTHAPQESAEGKENENDMD